VEKECKRKGNGKEEKKEKKEKEKMIGLHFLVK
jgi:hypothetical protein